MNEEDEIERALAAERAEWLSKQNTARQQGSAKRSLPTDRPMQSSMRVEIERIIDGETGGERFWVYEVTGGRRKAVSSTSNMLRAHEIEDDYKRRNVTVKWIDRR